MGEPFRAEIDLLSYPDTSTTLTPRLASPETYPPLGFRYNPALTGARLNIQSRANGRHVLEVVSLRPLNEPFVYLLVELESDATRIMRGYTALLDPPGYRAPQTAATVEYSPVLIPVAAPAVKPVAVRAAVADQVKAVARPAPRPDVLSNADAKTLAAMLERVAALEAAVAQLQRQWEKPAVAVAAPPPAAPPAAAPPPVVAKGAPVAVPSPPGVPAIQAPVTQAPVAQKPAAPVESVPRRTSGQDSLLNNALLVLAIGLLILLGGLVYVMWGRPAKDRPAKGD